MLSFIELFRRRHSWFTAMYQSDGLNRHEDLFKSRAGQGRAYRSLQLLVTPKTSTGVVNILYN